MPTANQRSRMCVRLYWMLSVAWGENKCLRSDVMLLIKEDIGEVAVNGVVRRRFGIAKRLLRFQHRRSQNLPLFDMKTKCSRIIGIYSCKFCKGNILLLVRWHLWGLSVGREVESELPNLDKYSLEVKTSPNWSQKPFPARRCQTAGKIVSGEIDGNTRLSGWMDSKWTFTSSMHWLSDRQCVDLLYLFNVQHALLHTLMTW